jgi:hypothetical protein
VRGQKNGQGLALMGLDQDGLIALDSRQALANPGQSSQQQPLSRPPRPEPTQEHACLLEDVLATGQLGRRRSCSW